MKDELILREKSTSFEKAVLANLDAGHNLARWLLRSDQDAQDIVQEACMKALRAFDTFRGEDFRAWFLAIVRNTCFTWLRKTKATKHHSPEQSLEAGAEFVADRATYDPQAIAIRSANAELVQRAIGQLPIVLREAVVLREMEGLSYKEIGRITEVPMGTVMSRLARGRTQLQTILMELDSSTREEPTPEGKQ